MNKILRNPLTTLGAFNNFFQNAPRPLDSVLQSQVRFRARQSTRIKKEKIKQANKLRKLAKEAQEAKTKTNVVNTNAKPKRPLFDDSHLNWAVDNVYPKHLYKERPRTMQQIYNKFKETSHPTVYNVPDGLITTTVELNFGVVTKRKLQAKKFKGLLCYPHTFPFGIEKKVLAFSKDLKLQELAYEGGAVKAGGIMLMKEFLEGRLYFKDFDHVVAAPDVLLDLNSIRVQLDRKFPAAARGTLGPDIKNMCRHFSKGIEYFSDSCPVNMSFGWVEVVLGRINQPYEHIEENMQHLLQLVESHRKDVEPGEFIRRVVVTCPPSTLELKLAHWDYLEDYTNPRQQEEEESVAKQ